MRKFVVLLFPLIFLGCVPSGRTSINNDTACTIECTVSSLIKKGEVLPGDVEFPLMLGGQAPHFRGVEGITVGLDNGEKYFLLKLDTNIYDKNILYKMLTKQSVKILAYHVHEKD